MCLERPLRVDFEAQRDVFMQIGLPVLREARLDVKWPGWIYRNILKYIFNQMLFRIGFGQGCQSSHFVVAWGFCMIGFAHDF